jgi:hypothetical protein
MPRPTYVNANVNRANYDSVIPIPWVDAGGSNILGGSWWDAAYTANGSTHWASEPVTDTDTVKAVNFNVTTLFQAIYDNPNHLSAVIVCNNSANLAIYAVCGNSNSSLRPTISYDGGSAIAVTENTAVANGSFAGIPNGSTQNLTGNLGTTSYERIILNVPPPTTRPTSATLTLTTTAQFGTTVPLIFWLRYPPESAPSSGTAIYEFNSLNRGVGRGIARGIA